MAPQDALIVRSQAEPEHTVAKYTGEDLARPRLGPANPFRDDSAQSALKRKNVLTGHAQETFVSEHTFRSKHRAVERRGGPEREFQSGQETKAEAARLRAGREAKGNASIADGDGAYVGPWAAYKRPDFEEVEVNEDELGSEEEYEVVEVEEDEDDDVIESGTVLAAPKESLARRKEVEDQGDETTTFHGSELYDYQGRTYMHVPQDLDVNLRKEVGSITNFVPRKLIHTWTGHSDAVTALEFFPRAGHLLLSGSADNTVKIWDVYHQRELLRTISGHTKAISDISFNIDGSQFLSSSYDRQMKLFSTETGQCINRFSSGKTPHCIAFQPSPEYAHEFLAGMSDYKILQFDTRAGPKAQREYDHHLQAINTITYIDENRRFMTTSDDKSLRVWEYGITAPIKLIADQSMYPMTRAAPHPNGKYVAYQSSDNQILVYSSTDKFRQNSKKVFRGHNSAGRGIGIDISPDGQFIASGDTAGYACFWSFKNCQMYEKLKVDASEGPVTCIKWSPQESSKVVTAGAAGNIKMWD